MKRIIALLLSVVLLFACGCQDSNVTTKTDKVQYVLAFNPSIMLEDGTIDSIRNDVASSMQTDMKAGSKTAFYEDTSWQWIYRDAEGEWNQRLVRSLTSWSDAAGNTKANAPYSYKMSDDGSFSLAVYDSSKMDIKGVDGVIGNSGIIMSFSGDDEEGICYTAIDEFTRLRFIYGYEEHSTYSSADFLKRAVEWFKRRGIKVECVQTDNGPEFTTRFIQGLKDKPTLFQTTAAKLGIRHKLIRPYTPRHNGKVERSHREDHNKFYSCHCFYSCDDLNQQLKAHLRRSNDRPMRPLGWLSPLEFLSNYRVQHH